MRTCNDYGQQLLADVLIEISSRVNELQNRNESQAICIDEISKEKEEWKKRALDQQKVSMAQSEELDNLKKRIRETEAMATLNHARWKAAMESKTKKTKK